MYSDPWTLYEVISHVPVNSSLKVGFWQEGPEVLQGSYSVDEQKHQITMVYEGEIMVANITITNGKQMLWESILNGSQLVVKATKR